MTENPEFKKIIVTPIKGKVLSLFLALAIILLCLIPLINSKNVAAADSLASVEKNSTTGRVVLSWTPFAGNLDGYTVYINGVKSTEDEYLDNSLDVTGALNTPGKYLFTVYTRYNGTASTYASAEYEHYDTLSSVTQVRLQGDSVVWDSVNGADGYKLFINDIYLGSYSSPSAAVVRRLIKTKNYSVSVVPYSNNNYYIAPEKTSVDLSVSNTPAVGKLYLSLLNGSLTLSWAPINGISSYRYTVMTEAEAAANAQGTLYSTNDTCVSLTSLVTDGSTKYVAAVSAYDGAMGTPSSICFKFMDGEVILS